MSAKLVCTVCYIYWLIHFNSNLGNFTHSCWFYLSNLEMVKAVTLAFCSNQQHLIRDIHAKLGIPNLPQSPNIGEISDRGIPGFRISGQSFIKNNCHNSRTSDDIDMKLGPVTKLDKSNKTKWKKFDDDVMLENCDVIVIFSIYGQFGAIPKPDSGRRGYKSYVFVNCKLLQKNADISKIQGALVLKVVFSETTYGCLLTCQIRSFWHNSYEF